MLSALAEKIRDNRFLRLIKQMLKPDIWRTGRNATLSGCPQGGVTSPILSNIYLDRLDTFVETVLIPQHTRGAGPAILHTPGREPGGRAAARRPRRSTARRNSSAPAQHGSPGSGLPAAPLHRYADDHILGFTGPKAEAEEIKAGWPSSSGRTLGLELNPDKTLITHARTQRRGSSAMTSPSSTATRNSPEAAARSTARSRCGSPRK